MKTAVRIIESNHRQFNHMKIQVLIKRWKDSETMTPIGNITFQQNVGEERWYGMTFEISTSEFDHLLKMAKLAKHISKNSTYEVQPKEILELIGAQRYEIFDGDFMAVSNVGKNLYYVMSGELDGMQLYTKIVAANESSAQKILDKKNLNLKNPHLKLKSVIRF